MKITSDKLPTIPHSLKEGNEWVYHYRIIRSGDLFLGHNRTWRTSASSSTTGRPYRVVATQAPIKVSLKKTLKALKLPMPAKVRGYKMKYAGVGVGGLTTFLMFIPEQHLWVMRSRCTSHGGSDTHYIELIPTKKLQKAIDAKEIANKLITELTK